VSLDTKYRPLRYDDVLGQEATIQVCKEYVRSGHGFQQSYVFAGGHGGGKTTLGRILARALLCESPVDGEPCDECDACKTMLADKSEGFIEVDAATNSGKDHVRRITEEAQFGTYSGQRRIYLFDESHELSRQAMDAMLKPLEDNIRGTQEKQLICIFCTTEVEKMRSAILSRCAPIFRIRPNTPEQIGARLAHICEQESIEYEEAVLPLIAEVVECHVRDAIKAVEGVSMLGSINRTNVNAYLSLDANDLFLDILDHLGADPAKVLEAATSATGIAAPGICYEKMADVCVLAYRLSHIGSAQVPSYWDRERLKAIGEKHKEFLIAFAQRFAERPARPTASMFSCDVAALHQMRGGIVVRAEPREVTVPQVQTEDISTNTSPGVSPNLNPLPTTPEPISAPTPQVSPTPAQSGSEVGSMQRETFVTEMGVSINPSAQHTHRTNGEVVPIASNGVFSPLSALQFADILQRRVHELSEDDAGSTRRNNVGGS
jgi:DNA polymerase III subunit gamma/tau